MCMLAFYTRDPAQILRIFNTSALAQRSKAGRPDYGPRTVAAALEFQQDHYSSRKMNGHFKSQTNNRTSESGSQASAHTAEEHEDIWIDPLEEDAFHGPAGEFALAVEDYYEGEAVTLLITFLLIFGNLVGRNLSIMIGRTVHYLNLFVAIVGRTALAAKGSGWDWVSYFFDQIDPFFKDRVHGGLSSGEGVIHCVRDAKSEQQQRGKGANRHTELVELDPGVRDKRAVIYEAEFSSALRVAARPENILTEIIRRAFDGAHILETLTKNNPEKATDAHLSIEGHSTPRELTELLNDTSLSNGFANRFVIVLVRGTKAIAIPDSMNPELLKKLEEIAKRVQSALEFASQERQFRFDDEARELWTSTYLELRDPGPDSLLGSLLQRGRVHTLRFAMVYAALDSSPLICAAHLKAALALWRYSSRSATFLFADRCSNPDAQRVFDLLKDAPQGMTKTAIHNALSNNFSKTRIDNALLALRQEGKACREKPPTKGPGRPSELWFAIVTN
jgi:Protein of unknown function (DUF3987)